MLFDIENKMSHKTVTILNIISYKLTLWKRYHSSKRGVLVKINKKLSLKIKMVLK